MPAPVNFTGCRSLTALHVAGYLVLPGFASLQETRQLKERAVDLVSQFDPTSVSVFSTKNQVTQVVLVGVWPQVDAQCALSLLPGT